MKKLICGDCLEHMVPAKCIFADPPDNIGLGYAGYVDREKDSMYYLKMSKWIQAGIRWADIFWLSYNQIHDLEVSRIINFYLPKDWTAKKIIWMYTFGQYNRHDFGTSFRPIWRLMKNGITTYPEQVLEESERMRLGDPRAAGPRVPGDVWEYPRVVGRERRDFSPTQHPVALYQRIVDFSCNKNDLFLDMFAGSGTCFLTKHSNVLGIEISATTVAKILAIVLKSSITSAESNR